MPRTVLVTGLGLMGGSLAAALSRAGWNVLLHHRRHEVAERAEQSGYGRAVTDPAAAMADADVAVVCTPVGVIADTVRALAAAPGAAVITDVGSTKGRLARELSAQAAGGRYVGSHPMAGSHRQGLDHADPELFRGRACVVTPTAASPTRAVDAVDALWRDVGGRVVRMGPDEHDAAVAEASHLPHILAATAAAGLTPLGVPLASSGFRDTTRVAAGSPELWSGILRDNRAAVLAGIAQARARLEVLAAALAGDHAEDVHAWLAQGSEARRRFDDRGH
ncbi:MAG TPA: prephenate dehydrogenase/arogenate dehydrogenase family protein [Planctomycetota bacterium]|nr:prephenate dehydrogenase/arogenate dehydrogenase family protein [Planctomycetota bacterium]